jgi:hypothetical protein
MKELLGLAPGIRVFIIVSLVCVPLYGELNCISYDLSSWNILHI